MNIKKNILRAIITLLLFGLVSAFTTESYDYKIKNTTFKQGEKLTYRLHYGVFTGALPTLETATKTYSVDGRPCHRVEVSGKTIGVFNKLFKVKDIWRSYIDTTTMLPKHAFRQINEGNYKLKEDIQINRGSHKITVTKEKKSGKKVKEFDAPEGIHDIVSGFYYFRNIDYSKKSIGDKITIKAFFDDELYDLTVIYQGTETIKTSLGKIKAIKLNPVVPDNEIFDGEDSIGFWLSDDKNKIPLKIKAKMFVGAVELDIKNYQNLRHTIKFD